MTLVSKVGGAAGPLYGTLFLQMGTASARPARSSTSPAGPTALEAGVKGVQARGKAEPEDKTMIDALLPAVDGAARGRGGGRVARRRAAPLGRRGASRACSATIPLEARKGRASYLGAAQRRPPGPGRDVVAPAAAHGRGAVRAERRELTRAFA